MAKNNDSGGSVAGGIFVFVVVVIAMVPKEVWIFLGVVLGIVLVAWLGSKAVQAYDERKAEAERQARLAREAEAARAKREREDKARKVKQQRIDVLGATNAARLASAQAAVKRVVASEAARAGWLGDVDFTADIRGIFENFRKARDLRTVADELSALPKPSAEDRKILEEAKATAADLERTACERVNLIEKCATEAKLVDESLRAEREDARTAEQRAALHARLSSMLYGIEAAPDISAADSTADAVMARVLAYREIKSLIGQSRAA